MTTRSAILGALVLSVGVLTGACSGQPDEVVLGIALNAVTHPAVELAVDEINADGGIRGVPLRATGLDWDTNGAPPEEIIARAHEFAEEPDLLGVIGHSDSSSTLTSAALYNRLEIPQLVTIATNPSITDIGPWTYRLCISDAIQGPRLAEYAVRDRGHSRLAIFYVNDAYGRGLARTFRGRARELGATIVASAFHAEQLRQTDKERLGLILDRLRELPETDQPDLFALFQRTNAGYWTIEEIRERDFGATILGGDSFSNGRFLDRRPPSADGVLFASFFVEPPDTPQGRAFERGVIQQAGREPDYGDAFAYDAVYLFRDAVAAGGFERTAVKAYLDRLIDEQREIGGIGGSFTLAADHDARRDFYIVRIDGDEMIPVATIPAEQPGPVAAPR